MAATMDRPPSSTSQRLLQATTAAFDELVLPALRQHLPEVVDDLLVTVTSSVAYGTADELSDLDVFVIFRDHGDYVRYARRVEAVIGSLDLGRRQPDLCDKGLRFELESLHRADLSRLYTAPASTAAWLEQTDWLLFWLLHSIPIRDPAGIHRRMSAHCSRFPPRVAARRQAGAAFRTARWATTTQSLLRDEGPTFRVLRAGMRSASACLDLAYLSAGKFAPHPKWRERLAPQILANQASSLAALSTAEHLTAALREGDPATLSSRLEDAHLTGRRQVPSRRQLDVPMTGRWYAAPDRSPVEGGQFAGFEIWGEGADMSGALDASHPVYLPEELGLTAAGRRGETYDRHQRISDALRWLERLSPAPTASPPLFTALPEPVHRKRLRYLSFVVWRKLRVVPKAVARSQPLTAIWYLLQVIDHLVELAAAESGQVAPPLEYWTERSLTFLEGHGDLRRLALDPGAVLPYLRRPERFGECAWPLLRDLQHRLRARGMLDEQAVTDPLSTQMDIQYWRYENLFV